MAPPGDRGHHVSAGGIPLNIRSHVVLGDVHDRTVRGVHKGQGTVHAFQKEKMDEVYLRKAQATHTNTHTLHRLPTSLAQPTPGTGLEDSRRCCLLAVYQTFLKNKLMLDCVFRKLEKNILEYISD